MKIISLFIVSISLHLSSFSQKASDDFSGKWKTDEGVIISISKTENGFIGKAGIKDIVVLKSVKFADGRWSGIVYNPKKDITANCELQLETDRIKIIARKGLFSKTIYWTK